MCGVTLKLASKWTSTDGCSTTGGTTTSSGIPSSSGTAAAPWWPQSIWNNRPSRMSVPPSTGPTSSYSISATDSVKLSTSLTQTSCISTTRPFGDLRSCMIEWGTSRSTKTWSVWTSRVLSRCGWTLTSPEAFPCIKYRNACRVNPIWFARSSTSSTPTLTTSPYPKTSSIRCERATSARSARPMVFYNRLQFATGRWSLGNWTACLNWICSHSGRSGGLW